jgi:hypothetical protein
VIAGPFLGAVITKLQTTTINLEFTADDNSIPLISLSNKAEDGSVITDGHILKYNAETETWKTAVDDTAPAFILINEGEITAPMIADGAVTSNKIQDSAVTSPKIADAAIASSKLASNAITTSHIQDGAVTAAKLDSTALVERYDFLIYDDALLAAGVNIFCAGFCKGEFLSNNSLANSTRSFWLMPRAGTLKNFGAQSWDKPDVGAVTVMIIKNEASTSVSVSFTDGSEDDSSLTSAETLEVNTGDRITIGLSATGGDPGINQSYGGFFELH